MEYYANHSFIYIISNCVGFISRSMRLYTNGHLHMFAIVNNNTLISSIIIEQRDGCMASLITNEICEQQPLKQQ